MTYLNALDPTMPPFDGEVGQGDDVIRNNTAAIRERMSRIVEDVDADPWVLKSTALIRTTIPRQISHLGFQPRDDTSSISRGLGSTSPRTQTSLTLYGEVIIPDAVQLAAATVRMGSFHSAATVAGILYRVFDGGGPDILATFSATANAGFIDSVGGGALPYNNQPGDRFIFLVTLDSTSASAAGDAQLAWANILVTAPAT